MYYATIGNEIGQADSLPDGGIEITPDQYNQALQHKASGGLTTIENGELVLYTPPVYGADGTKRQQRSVAEPLITTAPPDDLQIPEWDGSQWIEGETEAQKQERLEKEKQEQWDRIRSERDGRLSASDKYLLPDFPTDATQSEIESYRQALRDLPQNYDDPDAVEWPTDPVKQ